MKLAHALTILFAAGVLTRPAHSVEPAKPQAPRTRAERFAFYLRAVENAAHPSEAIAAYARGCAIDRENARIHRAYMRQMLKFGLPQVAHYAAQSLVALEPGDGMAWGVVGYMHARRGDLAEAFAATVRAACYRRDDPSILHNLGQLLAWYENEPDAPAVAGWALRTLERIKPDLMKREAFVKAYEVTRVAYKDAERQADQFRRRLSQAEADLLSAQNAALEIDRQLQEVSADLDSRYRMAQLLRVELERSYHYCFGYFIPRGFVSSGVVFGTGQAAPWGGFVYTSESSRFYRDELYERLRREQRAVENLRRRAALLRRQGRVVLAQLSGKEEALKRLRRRAEQVLKRAERRFRWDPPAVDGVVTPELDRVPQAPVKLPVLAPEPEAVAATRLKVALLYLENDMQPKAAAILEEIVSRYGSTKAGVRARRILAQLPPLEVQAK